MIALHQVVLLLLALCSPPCQLLPNSPSELLDGDFGFKNSANTRAPSLVQCFDLSTHSGLSLLSLQVQDIDFTLGRRQLAFKRLKLCLETVVAQQPCILSPLLKEF